MKIEDFSCESVGRLPPAPLATPSPTTSPRQSEPFLRGPVPISWLARAATLRKPALAAGLCLWFQRGVKRSSGPVEVRSHVRRRLNMSAGQMLRGLRALEAASLVRFEQTGRGRCPTVQIIDSPTMPPERRVVPPPPQPSA